MQTMDENENRILCQIRFASKMSEHICAACSKAVRSTTKCQWHSDAKQRNNSHKAREQHGTKSSKNTNKKLLLVLSFFFCSVSLFYLFLLLISLAVRLRVLLFYLSGRKSEQRNGKKGAMRKSCCQNGCCKCDTHFIRGTLFPPEVCVCVCMIFFFANLRASHFEALGVCNLFPSFSFAIRIYPLFI